MPRDLPGDDPAARRQVPARTVTYWRVQALLTGLPLLAAAGAGALFLHWLFIPSIRWALVALLGCYVLVGVTFGPTVRRRIFYYSVSADEIDLQHGLIVTTRTVVPMSRVQHLKTDHGPVADRFRLANLHVHTAAGAVSLRGLDVDEAERVRSRISHLANIADDT